MTDKDKKEDLVMLTELEQKVARVITPGCDVWSPWTSKGRYFLRKSIEELKKIFNITEESVSEDLEEVAYRYAIKCEPLRHEYGGYTSPNPEVELAVKYGANWQKEKLMKDAIDAEVGQGKNLIIPTLNCALDSMGLNPGDKVKIIIIKENKE